MKFKERRKARELRMAGFSLGAICSKIGCSKSSVSKWVRDIPLTPEQIARLKHNQDIGRAKAAHHPNSPKNVWQTIRQETSESAMKEIRDRYSPYTLKVIGSAMYWAEGMQAGRNVVDFSNSDPAMIQIMMKFFRETCKVPKTKIRGALHIHPHLHRSNAEKFWSRISGIPLSQFHKTQIAVSRASKQQKDTLPNGTFSIVICDTRLRAKIAGWIKGIRKWASTTGK